MKHRKWKPPAEPKPEPVSWCIQRGGTGKGWEVTFQRLSSHALSKEAWGWRLWLDGERIYMGTSPTRDDCISAAQEYRDALLKHMTDESLPRRYSL